MSNSDNELAQFATDGDSAFSLLGGSVAPRADAVAAVPDDDTEAEVNREELVRCLQEVVSDLSDGLRGINREIYLTANDLCQNDWFCAGNTDEEGQFAVTMWHAEEEVTTLPIGDEAAVHELACNMSGIEALVDRFIETMEEEPSDRPVTMKYTEAVPHSSN